MANDPPRTGRSLPSAHAWARLRSEVLGHEVCIVKFPSGNYGVLSRDLALRGIHATQRPDLGGGWAFIAYYPKGGRP